MEWYAVLTLEANGFHVARNYASQGVEDLVGIRRDAVLFVQVKNTQEGRHGMTKVELEILKKHAVEYNAIPIFLFKEKRKAIWLNALTNDHYDSIKPYTKEWYTGRQATIKALRELSKKNRPDYRKHVLENWDAVKNFIC